MSTLIGDPILLFVECRTADNVAADPTTITLNIHPPTGSNIVSAWSTGGGRLQHIVEAIGSAIGDGVFVFRFIPTIAGDWLYRWTASGAASTLVGVEEGAFTVDALSF